MPPPSTLRTSRASATNSARPHSREPTGAPSPLETQNITESAPLQILAAGTPWATAALKTRAPSMWNRALRWCAASLTAAMASRGQQLPPAYW